jgi:hypothetical protein
LGVALFGAVAGTATSPEFLAHTLQLLTAGALAFASASAICLVAASAFGKPEA